MICMCILHFSLPASCCHHLSLTALCCHNLSLPALCCHYLLLPALCCHYLLYAVTTFYDLLYAVTTSQYFLWPVTITLFCYNSFATCPVLHQLDKTCHRHDMSFRWHNMAWVIKTLIFVDSRNLIPTSFFDTANSLKSNQCSSVKCKSV